MKNQNYFQEWERYFVQYRPYLMSFSFRMSGSLTESEDIVQDAFISCAEIDPKSVVNHKSWLTKVCSNKALDHLKLAYKKREAYVGVWLPDAVPESFQMWRSFEDSDVPDKSLLETESLSTSFLLLLQKLTPEERIVYLLGDIFDYSFKEISGFLMKSEDACKKIAQRARKAFENQKRFQRYDKRSEELISRFFEYAKAGDVQHVEEFLSADSEFWSDSGGKVSAASRNVITDRVRTSRFFAGIWSSPFFQSDDLKQELSMVNSRPGLVVSKRTDAGEWVFDSILSFEILDGKIARIYTQRNPDKLDALSRVK